MTAALLQNEIAAKNVEFEDEAQHRAEQGKCPKTTPKKFKPHIQLLKKCQKCILVLFFVHFFRRQTRNGPNLELCCHCPPGGPENPRNSSRSKVGQ